MPDVLVVVFISYLVGSFPTAVIAGKILKKIDIRQHGSGNAGATNVFRVLGWKAGLVVLLIDIFKGFVAVYWVVNLAEVTTDSDWRLLFQLVAGVSAILGHIWTIFAGFKGGKGVGTAAGVFLGMQPLAVFIVLMVFIGVVAKTKYVSLGSIIAATLLPVILIVQKYFLEQSNIGLPVIIASLALALLILVTHHSNIHRLINGTENKLSFGSKGE